MSASESKSGIVLELAEEFLERYRQGQRPSLKEYIERHPRLAAEIKDVFPAMALMENIAIADESLADDATGPARQTEQAPPEHLGDYRILREVGRGGMGIVYEAEQVSLGRHVAVKVLPGKTFVDDQQRRRFEREAKAAAKLHHTNIVPVFGVGEHEGLPYYVMQFIQGLGLDGVLDELKRMHSGASATGGELRVARKDVSVADVARSLLTAAFQDGEPAANAAGSSKAAGWSNPAANAAGSSKAAGWSNPAANAAGSPESNTTGKLSDSFALSASSVKLPSGGDKSKKATYWQSVAQIGMQVADALEYAHKQGIQHRDIKPSNLLLDTAGTVWITDFGLACADNEDHLTQTGDIVGTLRYMPPEAFEGRADKRGDIYSLGLTLYELLALQPAFAERDRHRLIKRVTTEEPVRLDKLNRAIPRDLVTIIHKAIDREPGRRYQTAAELTADLQRFLDDEPIQARRISNGERLWRWCRRHPGVATLTATLGILLLSVTVVSLLAAARFDQAATNERMARAEAEAAERQAENNLQDAETAKRQAESNFAKARKAVDDYFTTVSESQLLQVPGMQPLRRNLLQSALTFYQDFLKERGDDPALRGELAAAFLRVATILAELDQTVEAHQAYEQARQLYESLTKSVPEVIEWRHGLAQCDLGLGRNDEAIALWEKLVQSGQPRFQKELANAYNSRALQYANADKHAEALHAHQQALALREMLVRLKPEDADAQRDLGATLNNIGVLLAKNERLAEALAMYRRAAVHAEASFAQAPQAIVNGRFLAIQQNNIADLERRFEHNEEALAAYRRVVEVWRQLTRDNPAVPSLHSGLFGAYRNLALFQRERKQTEQYERTMRRAREVIDRLPSEGANVLFQMACVRAECSTFLGSGKEQRTAEERAEQKREADLAMEALGKAIAAGFRNLERLRQEKELNALRDREDFKALQADLVARLAEGPDKLKASQQALALRRKMAQADPNDKRLQADLAASQQAIALILLDLGKFEEARKHLDRALAVREALAKEEPNEERYRTDVTESRFALGDWYWRSGRLSEGARLLQQQLDRLEATWRAGGANPIASSQLLAMRRTVARHYARAGLWAEATAHYERLLCLQGTTRTDYYHSACLAMRSGDAAAYRRVCTAMVKRFGDADDIHQCCDLAWACGLADNAGMDPSLLVKWARKRVGKHPPESGEWWCHVLGLADYRAGQFAEAISQARKSIAANPTWAARIMNWPIVAMSHHRLGHAEEARRWLATATAEWRRLSPLMHGPDARTVVPGPSEYWDKWWIDWPTFEILLREASLLIVGAPPLEDAYDHAHRGLLYSQLGDRANAEAEWQAAIKIAPREPKIWLARARQCLRDNRWKEAEDILAKIEQSKLDTPEAWQERARIYSELGQTDKAAADFLKAAQLLGDKREPKK